MGISSFGPEKVCSIPINIWERRPSDWAAMDMLSQAKAVSNVDEGMSTAPDITIATGDIF
jgi:hypothetical protein